MKMADPVQQTSILGNVEKEVEGAGGYVSDKINSAVNYVADELDDLGLSSHQQIGIIMIFFVCSLILFFASIYLFYWSRKPGRGCCKPEERFTVYPKMVEFEPIIVVKAPAANDKGPRPI